MARRVKVAKKTMKDPELIEMFNQMVGTSEPDPSVVIPKYEELLTASKEVVGILTTLMNSPARGAIQTEFPKGDQNIMDFIENANKELTVLTLQPKENNTLSKEELGRLSDDPSLMEKFMTNITVKYDVALLGETYKTLKDSDIVKSLIVTYRHLKEALNTEAKRRKIKKEDFDEQHDLANKDDLKGTFISKSPGTVLKLFNFADLNFKSLMLLPTMNKEKKLFVLHILHLLYSRCDKVYTLVSSPDVDVERFSHALVGNIDQIRKQIPRCDAAFDKIKESVGLLQSNFGGYYKDFITSQNPGVIVEHFVLDVADNAKGADPKVTQQFRKIVNFYKKNMSGKIKDPRMNRIFNMVGENLNVLEERTKRKENGDGDEDDEDSSSSEEITPEEAARRKKERDASFLPENMAKPKRASNRNKNRKKKKKRQPQTPQ